MKNLCLAGGCALNCVSNGNILKNGPYENIWTQPAAGDAGGALGAALAVYYMGLNNERAVNPEDSQFGSLLGPKYSDEQILETIYHLACCGFYRNVDRYAEFLAPRYDAWTEPDYC